MSFEKLLIANRGEIAVRVIRSCKRLGYRTVAVYSDADRDAAHVAEADEAVSIGPAPAKESYLAIETLIRAAKNCGAGAIHPGYGFLSERAAFARAVQQAGLVFIGPSPAAIEAMGDKSLAKGRMIAAGVPCIPGYQGADQSDGLLTAEAAKIGFPVMVKAAGGGGGRGMRWVADASQLQAALDSARSEASSAFGDSRLLIEKAVAQARHVEIQIFGDRFGKILHFGERDCSVQRRHQKLVEESPSPAVDDALRTRMGAAAVAAAQAVEYVGVGTVEFMLAGDGAFYFLEMNTRLQVEHPVTELVYGIDLVEWQLRVARGEALPWNQQEIDARRQGWAIEVRLCTEDPARDFLPQTGQLLVWRPPSGTAMRVDHGLIEGGVISPHYDSMQAKLIAFGDTRDQACRKMRQMLDETLLLGVVNNGDFLAQLIADPHFARGEVSTGFIADHFPTQRLRAASQPPRLHLILAATLFYRLAADALATQSGLATDLMNWQSSRVATVALRLGVGDLRVEIEVTPLDGGRFAVGFDGATDEIDIMAISAPDLRFIHGSVAGLAGFALDGDQLWLKCQGVTLCCTDLTLAAAEKAPEGSDGRLVAPIDGTIAAVFVEKGAEVKKGQTLAVLEAMKMEFPITSGIDGVVEAVECSIGQQVRARQRLVSLRPV